VSDEPTKVGADDHLAAGRRLEDLPRTEPPAPHATDLGNDERLVREHGHELRYAWPLKRWLVWTGKLWMADDGDRVRAYAKRIVRVIYREAAATVEEDARRQLARWAQLSESERAQRAMIDLARSSLPVPVAALDSDPWLFNVDNGIIDLKTGELLPHSPRHFQTKIAPVVYNPAARCPAFLAFLAYIFADDDRLIAWLQRALGLALVGAVLEQILLLFWGRGANGKSTLLRLLLALFGTYGQQAAFATFLTKRDDPIPNDLAALHGARLVLASESKVDRRLDEAVVKKITGHDPITARFLHGEFFTFIPACTLVLSTNAKPDIRDSSHAVWRRLKLVPFTVTIPDAQQDRQYLERVLLPEAPGILTWLVHGCRAWQRESSLGPDPPAVQAATNTYHDEVDPLAPFIEECCVLQESLTTTTARLYARYVDWARTTASVPVSRIDFGRRLGERGLTDTRTSQARAWKGIGLLTEREPPSGERREA
jgi:putative DNA primase/helicase